MGRLTTGSFSIGEVLERLNKLMGYSSTGGSGDVIPENVYPVADGAGGLLAGKAFTADPNNIAFGGGALNHLTTGDGNTCIGDNSGNAITIGGNNTCVGFQAGSSITNAANTVAFGASALVSCTSAGNVGVGVNAGASITNGTNNVFIGTSSGFDGTQRVNADESIAIGVNAVTKKDYQAVIGSASMLELITRGVNINTRTTTAKDITAQLSAADCLLGVITSTSAAPVSLTLPTAADLIAVLNGGGAGTTFDLIIDNSAGANTVTMVATASIVAITSPFTVTNPLLVTAGQKVGCFRFYFTSATAAIVARVW